MKYLINQFREMEVGTPKILKDELINQMETENGCPLCATVIDFEFDFIAKLQYKVANEENIRREIAGEGGFCDFHFRQFKKIASGKTNILLLKSIIETGAYKKQNFKIECRICKNVNEFENKLLNEFADLLNGTENKARLEAGNGICLDHLIKVDKIVEVVEIKNWLHEIYTGQIENLHADFNEMNKAKSFYDIDREKRKLINILIEKFAGRKTRGL